jgi:hypothetical protein
VKGGTRLVVNLGDRTDALVRNDPNAQRGRRLALVRLDTTDPFDLVKALNGQESAVLDATVPAPARTATDTESGALCRATARARGDR